MSKNTILFRCGKTVFSLGQGWIEPLTPPTYSATPLVVKPNTVYAYTDTIYRIVTRIL